MDVRDGRTKLFLDSDRAGFKVVHVTLTRTCDIGDAVGNPSNDEANTELFVDGTLRPDRYVARHHYVFDGGCAVFDLDFAGPGRTHLAGEVSLLLSFYRSDHLGEAIFEATGLHVTR